MNQNITILIPTYNRYISLRRTLKSLSHYSFPKEIIIIEQGHNNEVNILNYCKELGLPVRYKYLHKKSITAALNSGLNIVSTEFILLLDDDVVVKPRIIEHHLANYNDPRVGAVCGRVVTTGQKNNENSFIVGRISPWGTFTDGYSSKVPQEIDSFIGCNVSFRKSVLKKSGGADENFTQNAIRFEADLSLRIKKLGYKILFDPSAEIQHDRSLTGGTRMKINRLEWYYHFFSNEVYFFLKHKNILFFIPFIVSRSFWILRCMSRFRINLNVKYIIVPLYGIGYGFYKYIKYKKENKT